MVLLQFPESDTLCIIIHLRLNNVQQSMEKPGTQAQLIKTHIFCTVGHVKTRISTVGHSKSHALQQICHTFMSTCQTLPGLAGTDYLLGS